MASRHAVILTHNRHDLLAQTIAAIAPQVEHIIVMDNASDPPVELDKLVAAAGDACVVSLQFVPDQPPNLAALWTAGLDLAHLTRDPLDTDPWHVAFLCDDAPPPPGWFDAVTTAMNATGAAIGASSPFARAPGGSGLKTAPDGDIMGRMPGWAFILDPASGVRPDLSMHFWFCDTDMDWQARAAGGTVVIGGFAVPNLRPNEFLMTKPGLGEQAGRDGVTFEVKWGWRPW